METWHIGANDRDFLGWLTTIAYLAAAGLCGWCGTQKKHKGEEIDRLRQCVWWLFAVIVLFLGINKQLDLQTPLIADARNMAKEEGWYQERRMVQWIAIGATVVCGVALLGWLAWRVRSAWREFRWAFAGLALLLAFVAVRAAPVTLDDALHIRRRLPGKRHLLELAGIACVGAAAGAKLRKRVARE